MEAWVIHSRTELLGLPLLTLRLVWQSRARRLRSRGKVQRQHSGWINILPAPTPYYSFCAAGRMRGKSWRQCRASWTFAGLGAGELWRLPTRTSDPVGAAWLLGLVTNWKISEMMRCQWYLSPAAEREFVESECNATIDSRVQAV